MNKRRKITLAVVAVLAVLLAVNTVVVNRETKSAKADIGRIVDLPGGDIQVREDGSRDDPPIVLLHCFSCSMHWWEEPARLLARDHRVIRVDLLGHGGSEKPKSGYEMEGQARRVAAALDRLGVRKAIIVGHSLGGVVATAFSEQQRRRVRGVVTIGTPPNHDAGELPFLASLSFTPVIGQALNRIVSDGMVRDNLESAFAPGFDVPDQFVRDFRRMTYSSFDGSGEESDDYGKEKSVSDRLAAVRAPLLAVFGSEDELVDPDSASDFRKVPGARIITLPGTGHSPPVEKPARVASLIRGFERGLGARRSGH